MKNQYFGDKRDFLKYSLLIELVLGLSAIRRLSCIWLLTPPVTTSDGNKPLKSHEGAIDLARFLESCVTEHRRDVRQLSKYMTAKGIAYSSYGDREGMFFTNQSRSSYFRSIPAEMLERSVVFFDPDNGLEPQVTVTPAHLKYQELASVFARMDQTSLAVIYQHLPRRPSQEFWPHIRRRLNEELGSPVGFIAAGDVAFFVALRSPQSCSDVAQVLSRFSANWPRPLWFEVPASGAGLL